MCTANTRLSKCVQPLNSMCIYDTPSPISLIELVLATLSSNFQLQNMGTDQVHWSTLKWKEENFYWGQNIDGLPPMYPGFTVPIIICCHSLLVNFLA